MAYEHKPGSGAIFKNKDKQPGDTRPDYKGDGMDEQGNLVEFALWVKEGTNGKFFSVKISSKQESRAETGGNAKEVDVPNPEKEDLPF